MSDFRHLDECDRMRKRWEEQVKAFEVRYPNYCCDCQGWGYFMWSFDPSPAGVALGSGWLTDAEPCESCEGRETDPVCALCGTPLDYHEIEGWHRVCGCPDEGLPAEPDCFCWNTELIAGMKGENNATVP